MAELKEGGQVSCDTAHNLRLACSYITRRGRATARPHASASTSFAFCSGLCAFFAGFGPPGGDLNFAPSSSPKISLKIPRETMIY